MVYILSKTSKCTVLAIHSRSICMLECMILNSAFPRVLSFTFPRFCLSFYSSLLCLLLPFLFSFTMFLSSIFLPLLPFSLFEPFLPFPSPVANARFISRFKQPYQYNDAYLSILNELRRTAPCPQLLSVFTSSDDGFPLGPLLM